jgi:hypothetical protein
VLVPIYLLVLLILKPIGVHSLWHAPNYRFVFTTALIRYIWTFALLLEVITVAAQLGLVSGMNIEESQDADVVPSAGSPKQVASVNTNEVTSSDASKDASSDASIDASSDASIKNSNDIKIDETKKAREANGVSALIKELNDTDDPLEAEFKTLVTDANNQSKRLRKAQELLLAGFIFEFEADTHSRCEHKEGTKVVELNDYEILQISQNVDEDNAYTYEVIACQSAALGNPLR